LTFILSNTLWAHKQMPPPSIDVLREATEVASESDAAWRHMVVDAGVLQCVLHVIVSNTSEVKGAYPGHQGASA
jgi:hypothetical protein